MRILAVTGMLLLVGCARHLTISVAVQDYPAGRPWEIGEIKMCSQRKVPPYDSEVLLCGMAPTSWDVLDQMEKAGTLKPSEAQHDREQLVAESKLFSVTTKRGADSPNGWMCRKTADGLTCE